jgi:tetratricopeptide (TPR) repeat protein
MLPISYGIIMSWLCLSGFLLRNAGLDAEQNCQWEQAKSRYKESLACTAFCRGTENILYAETAEALSDLLYAKGFDEESLSYLQKTFEIESRLKGPENKDTGRLFVSLAVTYQSMGQTSEAILSCQKAIEFSRKHLGENAEQTQRYLFELGYLFSRQGRQIEADQILQKLLHLADGNRNQLSAAAIMFELSDCYRYRGRIAAAARLSLEALKIRTKMCKPYDAALLESRLQCAHLLYDGGYYGEAEKLYRKCLADSGKAFGTCNPWLIKRIPVMLARCCVKQGKHSESANLCADALESMKSIPSYQHRPYVEFYQELGCLCSQLGQQAAAESLVNEAHRILTERNKSHNPAAFRALLSLAEIAMCQGKVSEASLLAQEARTLLVYEVGSDTVDVASSIDLLARISERQRDDSRAAALYKQAFEMREKLLGPRVPLTLESKANYDRFLQKIGA